MHGPSVVKERRRVARRSASGRATIIADGNMARGCIVLDFSPEGARLGLGAHYPLPLRFELELPTGQRVKATTVWQRGLVAGVSYALSSNLLQRVVLWNWLRGSRAQPMPPTLIGAGDGFT